MKIRSILLWLVLMPTIIFIDIICFIVGIFSKDVRRLYVNKFYNGQDFLHEDETEEPKPEQKTKPSECDSIGCAWCGEDCE